ncbi:D111/G-patch domain-containing protein [Euphorbia peplus]|nr:D111/G-patch domain-containing protein [Euphorbia peplus]
MNLLVAHWREKNINRHPLLLPDILKKGVVVVDVVGQYVCDISMDDSKELVQGVNQDLLKIALPRRGGPVLVLT